MAFFREQFWIVQVAGLAIVAALAGSAAMTVAGTWLLDVDPIPQADVETDEDEEPDAQPVDARLPRPSAAPDIIARNVFCPTCKPGENAPTKPALLADAPAAMPSDLPLRLVATMEADPPAHSLATVYNATAGTTGVYAPGDAILSGVTLVAVGPGIVTLGAGNSTQQLRVGQRPKPAPKPTPKPKPKKTTKKPKQPKSSIPGADEAIKCSGNTCDVEREFVESLLRNPAALASQAAVRPTSKGFALSRVRRGSLPYLLGLRTGDVLTEVNGDALDSLDKAIALATKLRRASNLSVTLIRRGKRINKEIRIS